mgnify:CR=1 FL=1
MITYYIIYPDPEDNRLRVERVEFVERATARVRSLVENGVDEEDILVADEYDFEDGGNFLNDWED